jgi:membrane dipeptidase
MAAAAARLDQGTVYTGGRTIRTAADLDAAVQNKQYGVLFYTQSHFPLKGSVKPLAGFKNSGLRIMMLQYGAGDGNQGPGEKLGGGNDQTGGLTTLGIAVVKEMARLGMIVDLSHCNAQTTIEAAKLAKTLGHPVMANHVCCREVKDETGTQFANYSRNITDAEIRAIRDAGGVVGVMCYVPYVRRGGKGNMDDYIRHVEHVIKVAGIDHVGVSTDGYLDGTMANKNTADGFLDSPGRWKELARRMYKKGYSESELRKILGLNFLRVYRKVLPAK